LKKSYPTYLDQSAFTFSTILLSAGVRGMQIEINPTHLEDLLKTEKGELTC